MEATEEELRKEKEQFALESDLHPMQNYQNYPLVRDIKELNPFLLNILAIRTRLLLLTWTKFLIDPS